MAGNIAALGRITRTRRQVRLANGRCGGINAQLDVEVKLGNKQVTMSLLILLEKVDPLVLDWNFLKQVGSEIRCAGHEITRVTTPRIQKSKGKSTQRWTSIQRAHTTPSSWWWKRRQASGDCVSTSDIQREVSEGCLPNSLHKLPGSTKGSADRTWKK